MWNARVLKRAAQRTGRRPCWSPRMEGAECRSSKLPCGSLDGTRKPSSARLRPAGRGSGTFKECQSLVEGIFGLPGSPASVEPVVGGKTINLPACISKRKTICFLRAAESPCWCPLFAEKRLVRHDSAAAARGNCSFPRAGGRRGWGSNAGTAPARFRPPPQPSPCPGAGARTLVARTLGF